MSKFGSSDFFDTQFDGELFRAFFAGFESGFFRTDRFVDLILGVINEVALSRTDLAGLSHTNSYLLQKKAAKAIYKSDKPNNRGEIGELLLHLLLSDFYATDMLVSKIVFKDNDNDTVKGFDCVHHSEEDGRLQLWLGESKFYKSGKRAAQDIKSEIIQHLERDYLRREFSLITNKIDESHPNRTTLLQLLDENVSLDKIYPRLTIPALIAYESDSVAKFDEACVEFCDALEAELKAYTSVLSKFEPAKQVDLRILMVPMGAKDEIVRAFDRKLKGLQQ